MIYVKAGTTSFRQGNALHPGEVEYVGDIQMLPGDPFTQAMVWDDLLKNARPMNAQEIAQAQAVSQVVIDKKEKRQAATDALADAIISGKTDAVTVAIATVAKL